MTRITYLGVIASLLPLAYGLPAHSAKDIPLRRNSRRAPEEQSAGFSPSRAQAVVDAFRVSWEGYYKYAFPNDELKPVSNGFSNSR